MQDLKENAINYEIAENGSTHIEFSDSQKPELPLIHINRTLGFEKSCAQKPIPMEAKQGTIEQVNSCHPSTSPNSTFQGIES
jgi:hypothetical protein